MLELKFTQMQNKLSKALQCQYELVMKVGKTWKPDFQVREPNERIGGITHKLDNKTFPCIISY